MKSLFRQVRRRLGEGLVIVTSILLAFSLDAWWDSLQTREEAHDLLDALMAEVDSIAAREARSAKLNEEIVAAADTILERLRSSLEGASVSTRTLSYLFRTPTTEAPSSALSVWISSGRASLVEDPRLRDLLTQLPTVVDDSREEELLAAEFVRETLIPEMAGLVDLGPVLFARWDETVSDTLLLPKSQKLISLLETRRFLSAFVLRERESLQQTVEQIVGLDQR